MFFLRRKKRLEQADTDMLMLLRLALEHWQKDTVPGRIVFNKVDIDMKAKDSYGQNIRRISGSITVNGKQVIQYDATFNESWFGKEGIGASVDNSGPLYARMDLALVIPCFFVPAFNKQYLFREAPVSAGWVVAQSLPGVGCSNKEIADFTGTIKERLCGEF